MIRWSQFNRGVVLPVTTDVSHRRAQGEVVTDGRARRRLQNAARIFDAAMSLLTARGYDEVSVEEICAAAGVGRATFFRIYPTKADLLLEFNRRLAERIALRLQAQPRAGLEHGLRLVGEEIAQTWSHSTPGLAALALDFTHSPGGGGLHGAHPELLEIFTRLIKLGLQRGEIHSTLPAGLVASLALLQLTAPVSYWFRHPERDLQQLIGEAIDQWLHGATAERSIHE